MDYYIENERGEAVRVETLEEWSKWFETADRTVALEERGEVRVSTVFLGLNHAWGNGPPLLYETMIFGGPRDLDQWRYATRAEAAAGHALAVGVAFPVS